MSVTQAYGLLGFISQDLDYADSPRDPTQRGTRTLGVSQHSRNDTGSPRLLACDSSPQVAVFNIPPKPAWKNLFTDSMTSSISLELH